MVEGEPERFLLFLGRINSILKCSHDVNIRTIKTAGLAFIPKLKQGGFPQVHPKKEKHKQTNPSKINIKIVPPLEPKMEACGCGKAWGRNENNDCDICGNTGLVEIK